MSGPHIPACLIFKVMHQLLTLAGPWRKGGQKEVLQQSDAHAGTHAHGLGGRSLHVWVPCGVRERQSLEGAVSIRGSLSPGRGCCKQFKVNTFFQQQ